MICLRCWRDSLGAQDSLATYHQYVDERDCTPEAQAGVAADECPMCRRKTVHENLKQCVACGWQAEGEE